MKSAERHSFVFFVFENNYPKIKKEWRKGIFYCLKKEWTIFYCLIYIACFSRPIE